MLVGNAFLFAARFGDEAIPEILPKSSVLLQVDDDRGFAAFIVGDELDSGHGSFSLSAGVRGTYRRFGATINTYFHASAQVFRGPSTRLAGHNPL
jgi:hypothetical protein